ncbi:discoidin domain-containing protein [Streptomyces sp. MBT65]|uniref:galactose-binding domain-containing protein n=1 Tax=Streptomyces sp. MBT65 TaxID=1488395 RepID=UPI00190B63ED|nr:discoidin domain-containing protein [Streptomyces sp. MBT65]MBK3574646.1 discoidin domain-containing protein [Streptomyces sp. MBT65]
MGVTRRVFLRAAIAATAVGAAGATETVLAPTASAASSPGDVVGKVTVGYQGWFACVGDGAPINGWWHWSQDWGQSPSRNNTNIKCWPDVREYTNTYQTAYAALGNGQAAKLFSSYDRQTVNTHFLWLQQNGIDTAALQRFNPTGGEGPTRDAMATKVRTAAESYGRKFYIMYDVSNWTNMQSEIKTDWTAKMSAHTASSAYARQNGKPVVCIWGFGFNDPNHPFTPDACLDVVNWFKGQGCYVIGGVPREWRTGTGGLQPGFLGVYHAFHMISPWMVGAIGNVTEADNAYSTYTVPDRADCTANGIDYQPCVLPGDVSGRQRAHGDFMWRQFYNVVRAGVQGIYISMFDEFNEGNQIAKTAETQAWVPTDSGFLALDEDGTACSSDYYLRLTGDGGRMLKGQLALTSTRPTQPVVPNGGDTTPPAAPGGLTVTGHTANSVSLSWNTSTDNVGVTGYRVLQVSGSTSTQVGTTGSTSFTVTGLGASTAYTFDVVALDAAGNMSQPSNQVTVTTDPPSSTTNLALHQPTSESSHTQVYASGNATDGDANTYWESANNAFPQWVQVDLGSATGVKRIVLRLPPATAWSTRTQTISVQGGTDAGTATQFLAAAGYTFDPATGNTATLTLPATVTTRYVRLSFTANTGWPAGQVSEFQVFGA